MFAVLSNLFKRQFTQSKILEDLGKMFCFNSLATLPAAAEEEKLGIRNC